MPIYLEELYKDAKNNIRKNTDHEAIEEGNFITNLFEKEIRNPENNIENYENVSPYIISTNSTTNIGFLAHIKTRFYTEPNLIWQADNKNRTFMDLNAYQLEQTYDALKQLGSHKMEFIKTENRGYSANGKRQPHSWNIVEKENLIKWILE